MRKDSETEIDYLDFSYLVEIMKDIINDEKLLPSCIPSVPIPSERPEQPPTLLELLN